MVGGRRENGDGGDGEAEGDGEAGGAKEKGRMREMGGEAGFRLLNSGFQRPGERTERAERERQEERPNN